MLLYLPTSQFLRTLRILQILSTLKIRRAHTERDNEEASLPALTCTSCMLQLTSLPEMHSLFPLLV
jgi:hypothetical protein